MILIVIILAGLVAIFGNIVFDFAQAPRPDRRRLHWWIMLALGIFATYTFVRILRFFPATTIIAGCVLGLILGFILFRFIRRSRAPRPTN